MEKQCSYGYDACLLDKMCRMQALGMHRCAVATTYVYNNNVYHTCYIPHQFPSLQNS